MVGKQKGVKSFNWEHRGRRKSHSREKKQEKYKIHPEWAPEIKPKHRNSLPNRRQQGGAFGAAPLGFVVFHLVRISYVFGAFLGPCWTPTSMEITAPVEITTPTSIQAGVVNAVF